jgi:hypothetical protein
MVFGAPGDGLFVEAPGSGGVSARPQQEVNGLAGAVHGPVEIRPLAFDKDE